MCIAGPPNEATGNPFRDDCPNCRGQGVLVAVWHYVDPDLLTQRIGDVQVGMDELGGRHLEAPPSAFGITPPGSARAHHDEVSHRQARLDPRAA